MPELCGFLIIFFDIPIELDNSVLSLSLLIYSIRLVDTDTK